MLVLICFILIIVATLMYLVILGAGLSKSQEERIYEDEEQMIYLSKLKNKEVRNNEN